MYIGADIPEQWSENHVSAMRASVTSSSLFCLVVGLAVLQFKVLLLLIDLTDGLAAAVPSISTALAFPLTPLSLCGALRSFDDLECSNLRFSRWARSLAGDLKAYGSDSSSKVFPCGRRAWCERAKFRSEIPWTWRSLRFYKMSICFLLVIIGLSSARFAHGW